MLSRYMNNSSDVYLSMGKRVPRYLKGIYKQGIWYSKSEKFEFEGFTNSDGLGVSMIKKVLVGMCLILGLKLCVGVQENKKWLLNIQQGHSILPSLLQQIKLYD